MSAPSDPHEPVGQRITEIRPLTEDELDTMCIEVYDRRGNNILGIVLDSGMILLAMRDDEWNGPGALAAITTDGKTLGFS